MKKNPTYKSLAYDALKKAGEPLHIKELMSRIEGENPGIQWASKNPQSTMVAVLLLDIKAKKSKSRFKKTKPNTFGINCLPKEGKRQNTREDEDFPICDSISPARKGEIIEMRVAELISLYSGKAPLVCYRPISDDEGIDLIVKERYDTGAPQKIPKVVYLQVKSRFGGGKEQFAQSIKKKLVPKSGNHAVVFCSFDTSKGDVERIWFVPAIALHKLNPTRAGLFSFVAAKSKKESNKWNEYLLGDIRELAGKVTELMDGL